jgi:hypothetical protein
VWIRGDAAMQNLTNNGEQVLRRLGAEDHPDEAGVRAGEPGPLTANIVYEKCGKKLVPRLHLRKRKSGGGPTRRYRNALRLLTSRRQSICTIPYK